MFDALWFLWRGGWGGSSMVGGLREIPVIQALISLIIALR